MRHSYHFWQVRCLGPQRVEISKLSFFLEDRVVEPKNFVLRSEAETVEVDTKTFQGVGVPPNVNWGNFWTLFWKKTCNQ